MAVRGAVEIDVTLNSGEISRDTEAIKRGFVSMGEALKKAVRSTAQATQQAQAQAEHAAGEYLGQMRELEAKLAELKATAAGSAASNEFGEATAAAEKFNKKLAEINARRQDIVTREYNRQSSMGGSEDDIRRRTEKAVNSNGEFQKLESQSKKLREQWAAVQEEIAAAKNEIAAVETELQTVAEKFNTAQGEAEALAQVVPAATREVQKALQEAAAETAKVVMPQPNKYLDESTNAAREYAQQIALVENEVKKLETLAAGSGGKAAEKYAELSNELDAATALHRALAAELEAAEPGSAEYERLSLELRHLQESMQVLTAETQRYKALASEQATDIEAELLRQKRAELASLREEYRQLVPTLTGLRGAFQCVRSQLRELMADTLAAHPGFARFAAAAKGVAQRGLNAFKTGMKNAGASCRNALKSVVGLIPAFRKMGNSMQESSGKANGLGKVFIRLRTVMGAMLWRRAINAILTAVREGMQNLAKFSDGVNNSLSGLKSSLSQLKNQFAASFAPILTAVAPVLQYLIGLINSAVSALGQLFAVLTGSGTFMRAKKVQEDYAGSLEGTGAAAKEAKGELAGFDKLNVMNDDGGSSGGGGGASAADMFETVAVEDRFKDLAGYVERLFAPIKEAWGLYGTGLIEAWRSALQSTKGLVTDIAGTFLAVWENGTGLRTASNLLILLTDMGWVVHDIAVAFRGAWSRAGERVLQSFFDRLNSMLELLHSITASFRNGWNGGLGESILTRVLNIIANMNNTATNLTNRFKEAWETAGLGDSIMAGLLRIIDGILEVTESVSLAVSEWASNVNFQPFLQAVDGLLQSIYPLVQSIGEGLLLLWNNILAPLLSWICESALPKVIDIISAVITVIAGIIDFLVGVFTGDWEKAWEGIKKIFSGVWDAICSIVKIAFEAICGILGAAWEAIKGVASTIASWFYDVVIVPVVAWWNFCWDSVKNMFSNMWEGIKSIASTIAKWFTDKVTTPISNAFQKVGDFINDTFQGVKDFIKGIINSIIGFINGMMAGMAAGINTVIDAINTLSWDIPDWIPGIGGKTFGFNVPNVVANQIPMLAHGAVIPPNREFLAVLGDQSHGRNLEAPEGLIREIMRQELAALAGQLGGGDINIRFTGSLAQLARILKPEIEREASRRGGSLVHT